MKRFLYIIVFIGLLATPAVAQHSQRGKLSPWLRQLVKNLPQPPAKGRGDSATYPGDKERTLIAFIKTTPNDNQVLSDNDCHSLAHYGDLHIASIPVSSLDRLVLDRRVLSIEASPTGHTLMDSMAVHLNATLAHKGLGLPQAFTGQGIVMGVMDVGFDLTHPNFYNRNATEYRIRRFWDQVTQDTIGSLFPVGRDYVTEKDILSLAHSRDGIDIAHGTHTLGIAAGSGYDSPYCGIAPEADICLVANAVYEDLPFIDSTDVYKYTFATDALGFKYIFDYAQEVEQPCVISFSEGSGQDFWGYDLLYYEFIDSLIGPGRILVAAAGNEGHKKNWIHKRRGQESAGTFIFNNDTTMILTLKSPDDFILRLVGYNDEQNDTLLIRPRYTLTQPDSTWAVKSELLNVLFEAYPSCYHAEETCYDVTLSASSSIGTNPLLSLEMVGSNADVELWRYNGWLTTSSINPRLADGEKSHCIHSPSSAPNVISVGATTYRDHIINLEGDTMTYWAGNDGRLVEFSSTGPTMDGRIKPDCVAPGNNIISSYNSYYLEAHPDANDNRWDVARFPFQERTYSWNANSGTSMSTPAVGGAIALWLQACPTLSPTDVLSLLQLTCRHPEPDLEYPNNLYGYGEIDVYAGLLHLLGIDAINDIPKAHTSARFVLKGNTLHIQPSTINLSPSTLQIYDLNGRPVFSTQLPAGQTEYALPLPSLRAGIYAACLGKESTLIRIAPGTFARQ